jgi:hypothetical protein
MTTTPLSSDDVNTAIVSVDSIDNKRLQNQQNRGRNKIRPTKFVCRPTLLITESRVAVIERVKTNLLVMIRHFRAKSFLRQLHVPTSYLLSAKPSQISANSFVCSFIRASMHGLQCDSQDSRLFLTTQDRGAPGQT